ncbi:hypothetical protein HDF14_005192 [Edaphobacter lichenicola]|jgi:hypothetical protein|uniref:Uncharacterized protein n=1 Tax=Tunturiibacter gelidiferens TaxID=3069689 RepID=A0A9X0QJT3_9BACT|nr:hypothetical protein [Edaphobacter lichenicola]
MEQILKKIRDGAKIELMKTSGTRETRSEVPLG